MFVALAYRLRIEHTLRLDQRCMCRKLIHPGRAAIRDLAKAA
jgi:hypothetical protein